METIINFFNNIHFFVAFSLFLLGFYTLLTNSNLIKKMIGLNIMDSSIFLFLVSLGYIRGGKTPLIEHGIQTISYVNPLPQALVLTGIVVSFSINVTAFALISRINSYYGSIDTDEIIKVRGFEV